jgi:hypothetical protein
MQTEGTANAAPVVQEFEASVTRCPCGDNDDQEGFMIQCETCQVWQHGDCVGVTKQTVPDEYYCELCMPEHPIHVTRPQTYSRNARKVRF